MSVYDWIDPWAEMERLKAEIPRAREHGQRYAEERLSEVLAQPLSRAIHDELGKLAEEIVVRGVPYQMRQKAEEAMAYYAQAKRLTDAVLAAAVASQHPVVRLDDAGRPRFTAEAHAISQRDELLQHAHRLMAEAATLGARGIAPEFTQRRMW